MQAYHEAIYLLVSFILGGIPTGYLAGRLIKKIDIREHGSGNMGATNVFRTLGKGPGLAVLAIDIFKGFAAVSLLSILFHVDHQGWKMGAGLAAVLGHNYTPFLRFKGGKGVATSAGIMLGLAPAATGGILVLFILVLLLSRMISVSSLSAATALPMLTWYFNETGMNHSVFYLTLILAVFIWVRHKDNIKRIVAGTENKFSWSKAKE